MAPNKSYQLPITATNNGSQEGYQGATHLSCLQNEQTIHATQTTNNSYQ